MASHTTPSSPAGGRPLEDENSELLPLEEGIAPARLGPPRRRFLRWRPLGLLALLAATLLVLSSPGASAGARAAWLRNHLGRAALRLWSVRTDDPEEAPAAVAECTIDSSIAALYVARAGLEISDSVESGTEYKQLGREKLEKYVERARALRRWKALRSHHALAGITFRKAKEIVAKAHSLGADLDSNFGRRLGPNHSGKVQDKGEEAEKEEGDEKKKHETHEREEKHGDGEDEGGEKDKHETHKREEKNDEEEDEGHEKERHKKVKRQKKYSDEEEDEGGEKERHKKHKREEKHDDDEGEDEEDEGDEKKEALKELIEAQKNLTDVKFEEVGYHRIYSADVSGSLASVAYVAAYLAALTSECERMIYAERYCASDISRLLGALAESAAGAAAVSQQCTKYVTVGDPANENIERRLRGLHGEALEPRFNNTGSEGAEQALDLLDPSVQEMFDRLQERKEAREKKQEDKTRKQMEQAECSVDISQAVMFLARSGAEMHGIAYHCVENYHKHPCGGAVFGMIASLSLTTFMLSNAASECPGQLNYQAACSSGVSQLIAGVSEIAASCFQIVASCADGNGNGGMRAWHHHRHRTAGS